MNQPIDDSTYLRALLRNLSDDLTLPFLQVKTSLELLLDQQFLKPELEKQIEQISLSVDGGLQLVEAYRLALAHDNLQLPLEPVALGGMLQKTADQLRLLADSYHTDLVVDVPRKLRPVLAHRLNLNAMFNCLVLSMIRTQAAQLRSKRHEVILGVHKTSNNRVVAGVYSRAEGFNSSALQLARKLTNSAHQPLSAAPAGASSGILVADMLGSSTSHPLLGSTHHKMEGLAAVFSLSKQLQLV